MSQSSLADEKMKTINVDDTFKSINTFIIYVIITALLMQVSFPNFSIF